MLSDLQQQPLMLVQLHPQQQPLMLLQLHLLKQPLILLRLHLCVDKCKFVGVDQLHPVAIFKFQLLHTPSIKLALSRPVPKLLRLERIT